MGIGDWYNKMTKESATERAKKLQARLNKSTGSKWKIRVDENLGWHFTVYCGHIAVSQYEAKRYSCLVSDDDNWFTGAGIWSIDNNATTPEESILKQLQEIRSVVAKHQIVLSECEEIVKRLM